MTLPKIVITAGEPAGIGPDIVLMAAQMTWPAQLVCVADRDLLAERAVALDLDVELVPYTSLSPVAVHARGTLPVVHIPRAAMSPPGTLLTENAGYVLATLGWAVEACRSGECDAMVTGPIQKSAIVESGVAFSGHTEFLAQAAGTDAVVMLLAARNCRMALATTHLPLSAVSGAINAQGLTQTLRILHDGLRSNFGLASPRITVLGLNPHAGEDGHLGREEIDIIMPVCDALRAEGMAIKGPIPADTAFTDTLRQQTDAYLAMYHDQGLPVLKALSFGEAVNITLGLPIIRTSVDHGTALSLAGTGHASPNSLFAAIEAAISIATASKTPQEAT